jgi:hypothetical protein
MPKDTDSKELEKDHEEPTLSDDFPDDIEELPQQDREGLD